MRLGRLLAILLVFLVMICSVRGIFELTVRFATESKTCKNTCATSNGCRFLCQQACQLQGFSCFKSKCRTGGFCDCDCSPGVCKPKCT
ncbi:hypothetical protein AAVH_36557 [Aphelenchoides avenae]|nr:hypothetical protein AAVH_36557 [Aphelenchus avenae]